MSFFASLLAILLAHRMIVRPLQILGGHVAAFGRGELERRVDLRTGDELEQLAGTFNRTEDLQ